MTGGFLSNGRQAHRHLLRHLRSPLYAEFHRPHSPPPYVGSPAGRSHLLYSKFSASPSSSTTSKLSPSAAAILASTTTVVPSKALAGNGFVGWYLRMLESRPLLTKSLTAGALFATSSSISQMITINSFEDFDWSRNLRMAGYGLVVTGPSLHYWFNFISRTLPKRDLVTTFKKMFLGQAVYGPIMTAIFFSVNAAMQGETGSEVIARLKRDLVPTLISGLVYWPMCDFITFKFVPVRLQPLVSNSFSFLWTIYITYMASLAKASVEEISAD